MTTNNIKPTETTCNPVCESSPCTVDVVQDARGTTINAGMHLSVKLTGSSTPPPPEYTPGAGGAFVGQWLLMRQNPLPSGYIELNGTLYANADTKLPELMGYLAAHTDELTTEADWQARSAAASGTGGVPYYVHDAVANTLRMPDTRGDSPYHGTVGTWQGDAIRNITGTFAPGHATSPYFFAGMYSASGAFTLSSASLARSLTGVAGDRLTTASGVFAASYVVPTDSTNHPRRIGLTFAVYAGTIGA